MVSANEQRFRFVNIRRYRLGTVLLKRVIVKILQAESGSFADRVWPRDGSKLPLQHSVMTITMGRRENVLRVSANFAFPDQAQLPLTLTEILGVTCRDTVVALIQQGRDRKARLGVNLTHKSISPLLV